MTKKQRETLQEKLNIYQARLKAVKEAVSMGYGISLITRLTEERDTWANDVALFLLSLRNPPDDVDPTD